MTAVWSLVAYNNEKAGFVDTLCLFSKERLRILETSDAAAALLKC
jgi:hypothetical protein